MELRHLRYFAHVADALSFRRAAEKLHVSRPALSMQIKDLEAELGVQLLERSTTHVRLTAAGHVYLGEVREILARVDEAGRRAQAANAGTGGRLLVGEMGALTPSFLPVALRRFHQLFPQVEVSIVDVEWVEPYAALRDGRLDVGFLIDLDLRLPEGFSFRPVLTSPVGLAVGPSHPWAGRASLSLEEIVDEVFLVNTQRRVRGHAQHTRAAFEHAQLPVPRIVEVEPFDTLVTMISGEQGVSIMPRALIEARPRETRFVPIPQGLTVPEITLLAVCREEETSRLVHNFLDALGAPDSAGS